MNIPLRVKNLIRRHDTNAPYQIAKELNVTILVVPLSACTQGFFCRVLRRRYIFINDELPPPVQRFTAAHELGHILLHPGYSYYRMENREYYASTRREEEADEFAGLLLL